MRRRLRSILPCPTNQLIPETVCYRETQSRFLKKQADQALQPLKTGEAVRVKQEGEWRPAKVIEIADTRRSYVVETSDGGVYRCNRRHLHKDTLQNQYNVHTDIETKTEVIQPTSGEQERLQQSGNLEDQQQKASNTDIVQDGCRTRSGRLVKVPDRYWQERH